MYGLILSFCPPSSAKMLTLLDPLTSGDLLSMKIQLELTPFGIGVPSGMMAWFHLS